MSSLLFFVYLFPALIFYGASALAQQNTAAQAQPQRSANEVAVPHDQPLSAAAQESLAKGQDLMFKKHDAKASIEYFKKVVELDPAYLQGHILLGNAYMQTRQWAEAKTSFERAARLEPLSSVAFLGIG